MQEKIKASRYNNSVQKVLLDYIISIVFLILTTPIILVISIFIKFENGGSILFIQNRTGKNGKTFNIYKFRTMKSGSEELRKKYMIKNEADGPVFKIENDPRFTKFGKILSKTGLDELPQLINVLKGEMSIVGPRPFPVYEAKKIPSNYRVRELVKPGITSEWVFSGAKHEDFNKWMELDKKYIKTANLTKDIQVILETVQVILRQMTKFFIS